MSGDYSRVFSELQSVIDSMQHRFTKEERLAAFSRLLSDLPRVMREERDRAAYEVHVARGIMGAEEFTRIDRKRLSYWSERHRAKRGLPRVKRRMPHLESPMDLRGEREPSQATPYE